MKPTVKLYSLVGAGLIIPRETGVVYTNQTDGYACDHPALEGAFVPLSNDFNRNRYEESQEHKLCELFPEGWGAPSDEICDRLDELLDTFPEATRIAVDHLKQNESREAWVWVTIEESEKHDFEGFGSGPAILTWPNSD